MDSSNSLGDYLRAKRELLTPEDVGLPSTGRRRVQGLRREEAAQLAGLTAEHYQRIEQGDDRTPSADVLDSLATGLRLDAEQAAHLHELASPSAVKRRDDDDPEQVSARLASLIGSWPEQAVWIEGRLGEVLAANPLAVALSPIFTPGSNSLRSAFLDPTARELFRDWETTVSRAVAGLRDLIGPLVDDQRLAQLIGELSVRSEDFRRLWAQPFERTSGDSVIELLHPLVGPLDLFSERLVIDQTGQQLVILHAEPGSSSEGPLHRLAQIAAGGSPAPRALAAPVPIESKRRLP